MSSTAIQVAFPKVDEGSVALVIPTPVETPANQGLAVLASTPDKAVQARKTLNCKDLLQGETRKRAEDEAVKVYAEMRENTQVFMTYGTQELDGVNVLYERLLHEIEPTKIPELTALTKKLNNEMRGIKRKYDVSDPKVREKYEEWKGGILRFVGRARTLAEMLMEDVTSIEKQIDHVGGTLRNRQYQLMKNVTYYDKLYDENEEEITKLIYVIAVMELIRDLAAKNAAAIVVGDASMGDRQGETQATLAEFAANMEIKIAEDKGRLFVAWATSPQVRMVRTLNVGLAERINELLCVTIPTMKGTIVQWELMMNTKDAADMSRAVQEASNEWLQAYAAAGAEVVPMIAEAVMMPTLTPQTVTAMADSLSKQSDGIIAAMENSHQRRLELDDAIMTAQSVMTNASKRVSDELLKHIVEVANKPLEIATAVAA